MGEKKLLDIPKTELHVMLWPMLHTVPFKNGDWRIWSVPWSVCHSGAADWKASVTPRMSSSCSELVPAALVCAWDQARHREIPLFKRFHGQWALFD